MMDPRRTEAMKRTAIVLTILAGLIAAAAPVRAARIKDVVSIAGERGNPLHGIGLVVGTIAVRFMASVLRGSIMNRVLRKAR